MASGFEAKDLQSLTTSDGRSLEDLNHVVDWLHAAGLYEAESALIKEIENKFPDHTGSPRSHASAGDDEHDLSLPPPPQTYHSPSSPTPIEPLQTIDLCPASSAPEIGLMGSAEKVLEAWRSKSVTPVASPRVSPSPAAAQSPISPTASPTKSLIFSPPTPTQSDVDEYEDEDDVGFWRIDINNNNSAQTSSGDFSSGGIGPLLMHDADIGAALAHTGIARRSYPHQILQTPSSSSPAHNSTLSSSRQDSLEPPPLMEPVVAPGPLGLHPLLTTTAAAAATSVATSPAALLASHSQQQRFLHQRHFSTSSAPQLTATASATNQIAGGIGLRNSLDKGGGGGGGRDSTGDVRGYAPIPIPASATDNVIGASTDVVFVGDSQEFTSERQAGTAQWVLETAPPPPAHGSEAYRELMHFLDPSSPKFGSASKLSSAEQQQQQQDQSQGETLNNLETLTQGVEALGVEDKPTRRDTSDREQYECDHVQSHHHTFDDEDGEYDEDYHPRGPVGRVSSLGEAILQQAAAAAAAAADNPGDGFQEDKELDMLPSLAIGHKDTTISANKLSSISKEDTSIDATSGDSPPLSPEVATALLESPFAGASSPQQSLELAEGKETPPEHSSSLDTDLDTCSPAQHQQQQQQQQQQGGDPFSFPVTSPHSEKAAPDPAPLFGSGSWPSFRNLTPDDKQGLFFGYNSGTEDETNSLSRHTSMHRPPRAASSVGRSAPFNPQHVRRSSSYMQLMQFQGNAFGSQSSPQSQPQVQLQQQQQQYTMNSPGGIAGIGAQSMGQYDNLALYDYDQQYIDSSYEVMELKVIHRAHTTGFQHTRELPLRVNDLIAGRYQILDLLGQAAFSRAVQALDLKTGALVCLKVVKNNKDYFDQSLDEIRLLRYVNEYDPNDEQGVLRLYDFFYFKEHLFLVCELLRANLYEFAKYNRESGEPLYFTLDRIASVTKQILRSLAYLHSLGLVHADLKPENILMKSYSKCEVKVIDLGSSCYITDPLSPYVQSRSYRAPEVILGVSYDQRIDVWSLGCIVAELLNGRVLFQNVSLPSLLARMEGILGPMPRWMQEQGKFTHKFYSKEGKIFDRKTGNGQYQYLRPKRTSLSKRLPEADAGLIDFLKYLLQMDPHKRPTAEEAMNHPWLQREGV